MTHPQSRILVLEMLSEAGPSGCETGALLAALTTAQSGVTTHGAKAVLFKAKRAGLIFGKGVYADHHGLTFRYFAEQAFCDAYVFVVPSTEERRKHRRANQEARWQERLAAETLEQRTQRLATRNERLRAAFWKKRGFDTPPAKRVGGRKDVMPTDARKARQKELDHQRYLAKKARAAGKSAKARPGKQLVVSDDSRPATVRVAKRPVLTGEPIITSATRVTVAPVSRDYRFWVDPATVPAVFGAMAPGMYLNETEVCDAV